MSMNLPLVTVVTPVYNGQKYLAECIESVLAQTYQSFEYVIVNNCSTDGTLDVARTYARRDSRISIHCNEIFVNCEENHNIAFRQISPQSKYCKVVSADDWITSDCLAQMVRVGEAHPTVAIIGSYQRSSDKVIGEGLPPTVEYFSGRQVSRLSLLSLGLPTTLDAFGTPTSVLYRSDVLRKNQPFFPHIFPYADTTACYKYLQHYDFGFVHSILSFLRVHEDQLSATVADKYGTSFVGCLEHILEYGPVYLDEAELETLKTKFFRKYYRSMGASLLKLNWERDVWRYQVSKMKELGHSFVLRKALRGAVEEIAEELHDPKIALHKFFGVLQKKLSK